MINTPVRMALIDHYYKYLMFLYNRINVMYQGVGVFKVNTYILLAPTVIFWIYLVRKEVSKYYSWFKNDLQLRLIRNTTQMTQITNSSQLPLSNAVKAHVEQWRKVVKTHSYLHKYTVKWRCQNYLSVFYFFIIMLDYQ